MDWFFIAVALGLVALGTFSMLVSTVSGGGMNVVMIPVLVLAFNFGPGEAIGTSFLALTIGSVVAAFRLVRVLGAAGADNGTESRRVAT